MSVFVGLGAGLAALAGEGLGAFADLEAVCTTALMSGFFIAPARVASQAA